MPQATIHSRLPARRPDAAGVTHDVLAVTYSTATVPPRTVFLPLDKSSDEDVAHAIREDLAAIEGAATSTFEI